jgi:hypothetical protein
MWSENGKLLLMGSSAYKEEELPIEVRERIDKAMARKMTILVGEAYGACRAFQDYLFSKDYKDVIVGHAKSIRYNAGNWSTNQYGENLIERELNMIEDCDEAIIIWVNKSGVIANNLENLKKLGIPTFIYEYSYKTGTSRAGMLDPLRTYSRKFGRKEPKRPRDTLLDYM